MNELIFKVLLVINKELYERKKINFKLYHDTEKFFLDKIKVNE